MTNPFLVLGGVAVGIITAGIGVLAVPGWVNSANDSAAITDLNSVAGAQSARTTVDGRYASTLDTLTTSSDVRVMKSDGTRLYAASNPDGSEWLGISRSKSGTYFARLSASTSVGKGTTLEAAVIAAGTTITGPSSARVTAEGVPLPAPGVVNEIVYENLFRDPGATNAGMFSGYAGTSNSSNVSVVDASWSSSGKAVRNTWSVVGTPNTGDLGPGVGEILEAGKTYTAVYSIVSNASKVIGVPTAYHASGNASFTDRSSSVRLAAGVPAIRYITFTPNEEQAASSTGSFRLIQALQGKAVGDYFEISDVHLYEGSYDPSRPWFSGSVAPAGLESAWLGTENQSGSVAYK